MRKIDELTRKVNMFHQINTDKEIFIIRSDFRVYKIYKRVSLILKP